ncbi:hypothetical protein [Methylocystis parvus]|uniref:hypothetical protein n=1 Tax=Methylocystis parvus TaxID=134 RepID=UPI003C73C2EB
MTEQSWALLSELADNLSSPAELRPEVLTVIADRLEDGISASSRVELDALKRNLAEFFVALLKKAPPGSADAARGILAAPADALAAFKLGQIDFAQHLASQVAERRADDEFMRVLKTGAYSTYVRALAQRDLTGQELSEVARERPETVSRKLKRLKELGVVDCRREGTSFQNFLTPAARAALQLPPSYGRVQIRSAVKERAVQRRRSALAPHLQQRQTLTNFALLRCSF